MVGRQADGHGDDLALAVVGGDDAAAEATASLVGSRLRQPPVVPAHAAATAVDVVLHLQHNANDKTEPRTPHTVAKSQISFRDFPKKLQRCLVGLTPRPPQESSLSL